MSQRELVKNSLGQAGTHWCMMHMASLRCCWFSGNLPLANLSVVMSSFLIAYLLLVSRKADS